MKILSIIGARPQFIKCAPLSRAIRKEHKEILVHTGQHYDINMSEIFLKELKIPEPDYNLGIGSGRHGEQTGKMLLEIEKILLKEKPDMVLVYGDTNSTLAGSLAAAKLQLKLIHVEAGLRSFDRSMPEEINRVLTDHVSNLLFCPTKTAVQNLKKEGICKRVYNVGDIMLDSIVYNQRQAEKKSNILKELGVSPKKYLLATIHRPANTDSRENLISIVNALFDVNETIVFPIHPRTEKYLRQYGLWETLTQKIIAIPPVGYLDMLKLEANALKILTDSGGVQKEAYMLGVPCITIRENTEWIETVEDGWNVLVGANYEQIVNSVKNFCGCTSKKNVFGTGDASEKICKILNSEFDL
ncbi:UDP-N-acetylglucosamine 2-epimerase (non-hydrolyzing) [Methanosarcina sp. MSH10X1]|uniref:non-hydrolyzing UDP-N-acetylglucosamine 2-epimerase n=1 Tax=Methanosarcina sp. MSH10X1 TaxID=2507075 RepID=UPI000FFCBB35|nr:UDP-N-acetylglucosamine 2-epimerase (non-hydrolyzing) [Methanosarcina sp. MSH10X1]RXA19722.1 UDP-N-acetylglucosamine 2-epimerase (non-hydrolyzing) [Methanosarcina sp. MSH10X1]